MGSRTASLVSVSAAKQYCRPWLWSVVSLALYMHVSRLSLLIHLCIVLPLRPCIFYSCSHLLKPALAWISLPVLVAPTGLPVHGPSEGDRA